MEQIGHLRVRRYGDAGPTVIVLHGGPAAVGSVAPIARGLADSFRVIEPWQRGSGDTPLSVNIHVEDLNGLVVSCSEDKSPALVGWSWGAMLALAYAAAYPDRAGPIVLVGCGTFDRLSRARMREILRERTDDRLREELESLAEKFPDPETQLVKHYELIHPLYNFESVGGEEPTDEPFDMRAHTETWDDMLCLQELGVYPAAFADVTSPIIMLHGDHDPHPGGMIFDCLKPIVPQLEYHELQRCGHSPWLEKHARDEFFEVMREWLGRRVQ